MLRLKEILTQGCIQLSGLWVYSPPRPLIFFPAIKQYILGLNSVKLCCSIYILPFSTIKSVKTSKFFFFLFFQAFDFLPHLQTLWFYCPPTGGGGGWNAQLFTRLWEYFFQSMIIKHFLYPSSFCIGHILLSHCFISFLNLLSL